MTAKEVANIYIRLRQEGWDDTKTGDFVVSLGMHDLTAEETKKNQK